MNVFGVKAGINNINILLYADDIVLLASPALMSVNQMQYILENHE